MKERNGTVDIAKGLGILLVVLGHNNLAGSPNADELSRIIFSFHVPLFFFLSGVFLKESVGFKDFLLSRANGLLKPFFVVLITLGFLRLTVALTVGSIPAPDLQYVWGLLWGNGVTIIWPPLWFLPHLLVALSFALLVIKATKTLASIYLAIIALLMLAAGINTIGVFWSPAAPVNAPVRLNQLPGLPWGLDIMPITSAFVLFGYLCRKPVKAMSFSPIGLAIALCAFASMHYFFDETMNLNMRQYGNPVISTIQAASGIYITLSLAALLNRFSHARNIFSYIGLGSLVILLFHSSIEAKVFKFLSQTNGHAVLDGLASFVIAVILSLALWRIAKRQKLMKRLLLPN